jgi:hypothetical protein
MEVGHVSTKPDTIWCVDWGILYYFAQDIELIRALMVDYKIYLLKVYTYNLYSKIKSQK